MRKEQVPEPCRGSKVGWRHHMLRAAAATALVASFAGFGISGHAVSASTIRTNTVSSNGCYLGNGISHVIYIQFDNVHLFRDNQSGDPSHPQYNVPSDLEQMPNLLGFMERNGFVSSNHHTPLIAHTGTDILTSLTGVYPDKFGVPIANSYRYFLPTGNSNGAATFTYWTDPLFDYSGGTGSGGPSATDHNYNMVTQTGANAPAPWVPYTRAGCNVGNVATANTVIENPTADVPVIFGQYSSQETELLSNPLKATTDVEGLAVHCASGNAVCANGETDALPDEPNGYNGYQALFGAQQIDASLNGGNGIQDLNGSVITEPSSNHYVGFPGFDGMSAAVSLGYVAKMQESGVPVTYAYISDAHDQHVGNSNGSITSTAQGPGMPAYEAQLHAYDQAFGTFFNRLNSDGINSSNTLFVFTSDENDDFVGGGALPSGCNGVSIPCTSYLHLGELNVDYPGLLNQERGNTTPFKVHSDSAPNVWITGNPSQTDPITRQLERDSGALTATNPLTGNSENISNYVVDQTGMRALHMMSYDSNRNPTFTMFAKPDYYLYGGSLNCDATTELQSTSCLTEPSGFAYNHGDFAPIINNTWLGMAGPGIKPHQGWVGAHLFGQANSAPWSDHTDIRPTMLALAGLRDDYQDDGRVLTEFMTPSAIPAPLRVGATAIPAMQKMYKQLDASVGQFAMLAATIDNEATTSGSNADDSLYVQYSNAVAGDTVQRDSIASQMASLLWNAEFNGVPILPSTATRLNFQGQILLTKMYNQAHPAP